MAFHQKALAIREEVLEATHPDLATYNSIGSTYWSMGRYEEALKYEQKALAIREEVLEATHPDLAISYNIGVTYWSRSRYEEAYNTSKKPLPFTKKSWRPNILIWRLPTAILE